MGISKLFPVQVALWQETVGPGDFERDLCTNSPTGSGKTLAYALPIVQNLSTDTDGRLRALVVISTRDLALQVKRVFDALASPLGLRKYERDGSERGEVQRKREKEANQILSLPRESQHRPFANPNSQKW
ncbi:hypothetical protein JHK86_039736 [Glycine max]|nr:hypothetical protein JHK86_039736 [Glycine max]